MSPCMKRYIHAIQKVFYAVVGVFPIFCAVLNLETMGFKEESNLVAGLTKADFDYVHIILLDVFFSVSK